MKADHLSWESCHAEVAHYSYNLPVAQANEQYSSIEAGRRLKQVRQAGRKQKVSKEEVDRVSAVIIFENWYQSQ